MHNTAITAGQRSKYEQIMSLENFTSPAAGQPTCKWSTGILWHAAQMVRVKKGKTNPGEWEGKPFHPLRIGDWHIGQLAGAEWAKSKRR